ncbi:DUF3995 domain-containing protein [Sphingobacterium sp. LRF_L2]|uniref:DUF3995 domain-containing protein n=1 Tax=Sphingobacterium sp. LRF_L2 TaxID=3369421 RepID=UPI003F62BEF9
MIPFLASMLILIFLFLSAIHFYWAFGGQWGNKVVIPTKDDQIPLFTPRPLGTAIVALGLLFFGMVVFINSFYSDFNSVVGSNFLQRNGLWSISIVFTLRAVGEFKYVGFFKKYRATAFGRNDSQYFSPLCLLIGLLSLILAWIT